MHTPAAAVPSAECWFSPSLLPPRVSVRLVEFFSFQSDFGVLMVCIEKMIGDLLNWLPLMLTITLGAALGFNILAPSYSVDGSPPPLQPIPDLYLDLSAGGPFMASFWALFGYYDPPSIAAGRSTAFIAPFFMCLYPLFRDSLSVHLHAPLIWNNTPPLPR